MIQASAPRLLLAFALMFLAACGEQQDPDTKSQTGEQHRALQEAVGQVMRTEIEAERIAAHSRAWVMPCLWAANTEFDAADDVLAADPSVNEIVDAYEFADEKYYQLDWTEEVDERIDTYVDQRGSILDAEATADGWQLRIRFVSRDQFDAFLDAFRAAFQA
jgi:hypothetical protein